MSRFFVDGREIELPSGRSSMDQVLKDLEEIHLPPNSGISQIKIDGLPLVPVLAQKTDLLHRIDLCERIEIFTASISEIACDSISDTIRLLDQIETISLYFTANRQDNDSLSAFENLKVMVEVCCWTDALIDRLERDFCKSSRDEAGSFSAALDGLKQLRGKGDLASTSKVLDEKVLSFVPVWRERLNRLSRTMNV